MAAVAAAISDMDGVLTDSESVDFDALRRLRRARAPHGPVRRALPAVVLDLVPHRTLPMPGVPGVPRALAQRGFALALASSATPAIIDAPLRALGVRHLFPILVSGVDVVRGEPEPDVFLEAASRPDGAWSSRTRATAFWPPGAPRCGAAVVPSPSTSNQSFAEADVEVRELPELLALPELATPHG